MANPRLASVDAAMAEFHRRVDAGKVSEPRRKKKPRPKSDTPSEYVEQGKVCDWLKAKHVYYAAVPNGAYLSGTGQERGIRWRMLARVGAKPGFPDLVVVLLAPLNGKPTAIEMKRVGGKCSEEQRYWHALMGECGWNVVIGMGADDAIRQLEALGYGRRGAA